MIRNEPEKNVRMVLDACANCDTCRDLIAESCLLFPELYRLYDKEKEGGIPVTNIELRKLAELCTLCGLCPCPVYHPVEMFARAYETAEGLKTESKNGENAYHLERKIHGKNEMVDLHGNNVCLLGSGDGVCR